MPTPTIIRTALSREGKTGTVITYHERGELCAVFQVYTPVGAVKYQMVLEYSSPWSTEELACGEWAEWLLRNQDNAEVA